MKTSLRHYRCPKEATIDFLQISGALDLPTRLSVLVVLSQDGKEGQSCETVIMVNGTHTMRGEQETTWVPHLPDLLYLGGAPRDMTTFTDSELSIPRQGLRGCITSFLLADQAERRPLIGPDQSRYSALIGGHLAMLVPRSKP